MHAAIRDGARRVAAIGSDSSMRDTNCGDRMRQLPRRKRMSQRTDSLRFAGERIKLREKMVADAILQIHGRDVNKESLCSSYLLLLHSVLLRTGNC